MRTNAVLLEDPVQAREARFFVHVRNDQRLLLFVHPPDCCALGWKLAERFSRLTGRLAHVQAHQAALFVVQEHAQEDEVNNGVQIGPLTNGTVRWDRGVRQWCAKHFAAPHNGRLALPAPTGGRRSCHTLA